MTGKKQIWKILNQAVLDIDKIDYKIIDYMDINTKEYEILSTMIGNVRHNLSNLEINLFYEIERINEASKYEKRWKTAINKVGNLQLNFLDSLVHRINKQNKIIQAQKDNWNI